MHENKDRKIESKEIFRRGTSVQIIHDGQVYYLKITKANKLILTK